MKYLLKSLIMGADRECIRIAENLQQYLDGEIDDDTALKIQSHLDMCRDCGLEADAYFQLKATLARRGASPDAEAVDRLRDFVDRLVTDD